MKLKQGFTLIEVVIVIGIVGILTVVIFPAVNEIRAKNRDAERIADIAALQLGLSLYKNQDEDNSYPRDLNDLVNRKYVPQDSIIDPKGGEYFYIPLTRDTDSDPVCTYYHLGAQLELPSTQIDPANSFDSTREGTPLKTKSGLYLYCVDSEETGFVNSTTTKFYAVHP